MKNNNKTPFLFRKLDRQLHINILRIRVKQFFIKQPVIHLLTTSHAKSIIGQRQTVAVLRDAH